MKRQLRRRLARGGASLALAFSTLWAVAAAAPAQSLGEAARTLGDALPLLLLRFERGAGPDAAAPFPARLALWVTPLLLEADAPAAPREAERPPAGDDAREAPVGAPEAESAAEPDGAADGGAENEAAQGESVPARDNGMPATTLRPAGPEGYLVSGRVYVGNASSASLTEEDLRAGFTPPEAAADGPLVLIVHTHGCEAYTMPPGEEYDASDDHRTLDGAYNVLRVGDEIARVLEESGIGVVHDRTLHDYPNYSGSYERSLATVERRLAEHPSIAYVLDVHRDAVESADGRPYKLLCAEAPGAAQLEFVIGSDGGGLKHDGWRGNLRLACAVQERLLADYPTLMRPISVRNSRYNQQACPGSLLLEVGASGNSLDEALAAARLFARGFAETIKG